MKMKIFTAAAGVLLLAGSAGAFTASRPVAARAAARGETTATALGVNLPRLGELTRPPNAPSPIDVVQTSTVAN